MLIYQFLHFVGHFPFPCKVYAANRAIFKMGIDAQGPRQFVPYQVYFCPLKSAQIESNVQPLDTITPNKIINYIFHKQFCNIESFTIFLSYFFLYLFLIIDPVTFILKTSPSLNEEVVYSTILHTGCYVHIKLKGKKKGQKYVYNQENKFMSLIDPPWELIPNILVSHNSWLYFIKGTPTCHLHFFFYLPMSFMCIQVLNYILVCFKEKKYFSSVNIQLNCSIYIFTMQ